MTTRRSHMFVSAVIAVGCAISFTYASASEAEYQTKIQSVIGQLNGGSAELLTETIDADALLTRVFDGTEVSASLTSSFSNTVRKGIRQLAENIRNSMPEGEYAKLLKVRRAGDKVTALVRYGYGNGGFGYHEYELQKDAADNVKIVDWLDYQYGSLYSDSLRLSVVAYNPSASAVKGLVPEYQGSDEIYERLSEVIKAFRDKEFQKFYTDYAGLPRDLRGSRFMTLLTCQVSRMSRDRNLYNEAFRALAAGFGSDPTLALVLLPYYFSRADYDEVSRSLRLLQDSFGVRDAALLALMSRTALGRGSADEAAVLADEAVSVEPELETPYWAAIDAHVMLRHYSFAVMTAKSLEEQFEKSLGRDRFEENAMYADFVKSPQYRQWQSAKR